jgi:hypothetical protein
MLIANGFTPFALYLIREREPPVEPGPAYPGRSGVCDDLSVVD